VRVLQPGVKMILHLDNLTDPLVVVASVVQHINHEQSVDEIIS